MSETDLIRDLEADELARDKCVRDAAYEMLAVLKAVDTDSRDAYDPDEPDCDCNAGDVIIPSYVWDLISAAIDKAEGR